MKHLGFTGTQTELTDWQKVMLQRMLHDYRSRGFTHLHHGDCISADATAHRLAIEARFQIVVHPPENNKKRAYAWVAGERATTLDPKPYLERNRDIVDACELLLACPKEGEADHYLQTGESPQRSGTWATVRYAVKMQKQVVFV